MTESATQAIYGKGTVLTIDGDEVAEITTFGDIKPKRETKDVTHHNSPGDYKEYINGLIDAGDLTLEGNLRLNDTAGQMALSAAFGTGAVHAFIMTFPDDIGSWTFNAIVTEFGTKQPKDDKLGFAATLKITGPATLGVTLSAGLTTPFLSASTGTLFPAAAQATTEYYLPVIAATATITVTPTAAAGVITVQANGVTQTVTSGAASTAITLGAAGTTTEVLIYVKEAGHASKMYRVLVGRAAS
jgi:predicted secreted protein